MIGIVMGSGSDLATMIHAGEALEALDLHFELRIISAHRRLDAVADYGRTARGRGLSAIIAGAGGAAHLPGVLAAATTLPVIGVPVPSSSLGGLDSLYAIVQMPKGIPVGTVAIGKSGAFNAGLLAAAILAVGDPALAARIEHYREELRSNVIAEDEKLVRALGDRQSDETLRAALQRGGMDVP